MRHSLVFGAAFFSEDFHLDTGNVFRTATGATVVLPQMNIANPNTTYTGPINFIQASAQDGERKNQAVYIFDNIEFQRSVVDQWRHPL